MFGIKGKIRRMIDEIEWTGVGFTKDAPRWRMFLGKWWPLVVYIAAVAALAVLLFWWASDKAFL